MTFGDDSKAWASPSPAKGNFGKIIDYAMNAANWIDYRTNTMTKPPATKEEDWKKPYEYNDDHQDISDVVLGSIRDLGNGDWAWSTEDGSQRYGSKGKIPHVIVQFEYLTKLQNDDPAAYKRVEQSIDLGHFLLLTGEDKLVMSEDANVKAEDIRTDLGNLMQDKEGNGVIVRHITGKGEKAVYELEAKGYKWLIPANMYSGPAFKEFIAKLEKVSKGETVEPEANFYDGKLNELTSLIKEHTNVENRMTRPLAGDWADKYEVLVFHKLQQNPHLSAEDANKEAMNDLKDRLHLFSDERNVFIGYLDRHGGNEAAQEIANRSYDKFHGKG